MFFTRRKVIKILILLLPLLLCSCQVFVEYQDYVHKPTHTLRDSLVHSARTRVRGAGGRQLIFVPNFRSFSESYAMHRADLLIVSSTDQQISVIEAVLHNKDTGTVEKIALDNENVNFEPMEGTGYYIDSLPIFRNDNVAISNFNTAKNLELIVTYSDSNDEVKKEILVIKLTTKTDIAWPT